MKLIYGPTIDTISIKSFPDVHVVVKRWRGKNTVVEIDEQATPGDRISACRSNRSLEILFQGGEGKKEVPIDITISLPQEEVNFLVHESNGTLSIERGVILDLTIKQGISEYLPAQTDSTHSFQA